MEKWMFYALLAMVFAGVTAIFAKYGLEEVDADLGLFIRTAVIFALVLAAAWSGGSLRQFSSLTGKHFALLGASGLTAFLSWIYYFRAIKEGPVTYVAAIDKASIVVTLVLAFILLREPLKPQVLIGGGLILAGMLVLVWK
ncbi:MAG: EamA family transporter [Bacteroidetes bacterium]|nr:MAG: EamA family transporter [Bacteroidota bacterium]